MRIERRDWREREKRVELSERKQTGFHAMWASSAISSRPTSPSRLKLKAEFTHGAHLERTPGKIKLKSKLPGDYNN